LTLISDNDHDGNSRAETVTAFARVRKFPSSVTGESISKARIGPRSRSFPLSVTVHRSVKPEALSLSQSPRDWKSSFAQSLLLSGACHYASDNLRDVDESLRWPLNIQSATAPDSPVIIDIDSSRLTRLAGLCGKSQLLGIPGVPAVPGIALSGVRVTGEFQRPKGGGRLISPPIEARLSSGSRVIIRAVPC